MRASGALFMSASMGYYVMTWRMSGGWLATSSRPSTVVDTMTKFRPERTRQGDLVEMIGNPA
jgi:hypothetical protein